MTGGNCLSNTFKRVYRVFFLKVSIVWHMIFFKCPVFSKFTPITCLHPSSVYTALFCKILALKLRKIFVLTDFFVILTKKIYQLISSSYTDNWHFSTYFFHLDFFVKTKNFVKFVEHFFLFWNYGQLQTDCWGVNT